MVYLLYHIRDYSWRGIDDSSVETVAVKAYSSLELPLVPFHHAVVCKSSTTCPV